MKKLMIVLLVFLTGCASSTAKTVEINKDSLPSVYAVLGKKKITGTSKSIENGVHTLELTYAKGSISEDEIFEYTDALRDLGFLVTVGLEENPSEMRWQVGKASQVSGHVILVDFFYSENQSVVIRYATGEGTITPN